jgi:hypothetical protein
MGSIPEKNRRPNISCYCPFNAPCSRYNLEPNNHVLLLAPPLEPRICNVFYLYFSWINYIKNCPFNASFWFPWKQTIVYIVSGWFAKDPELKKKRYYKVGELAGDCKELRNCGSQILKVRNGTSSTFFSPQFRNLFGSPQYCGIAEVRTKIADAHLCLLPL